MMHEYDLSPTFDPGKRQFLRCDAPNLSDNLYTLPQVLFGCKFIFFKEKIIFNNNHYSVRWQLAFRREEIPSVTRILTGNTKRLRKMALSTQQHQIICVRIILDPGVAW